MHSSFKQMALYEAAVSLSKIIDTITFYPHTALIVKKAARRG